MHISANDSVVCKLIWYSFGMLVYLHVFHMLLNIQINIFNSL